MERASRPPPPDLPSYLAAVRPRIEEALAAALPDADLPPQRLHAAMRYSVLAGGKRIRPLLALMAGSCLGAAESDLLPGAAALELIHTFSLIHDDLPALDDDDLRRGRPTLHRAFDEATAILAGDALLALAFTRLAGEPAGLAAARRCRAVALVGEAVGAAGMIGGQVDDLAAAGAWPDEPMAALESIHRRKTGALLTAALRLGGAYAGAGLEEDELLRALGARLGLLFQIADDILDVEGDAAVLGKAVRKDDRTSKLTYPALYGVAGARSLLERARDESLEVAARLPQEGGLLPALVLRLAGRDR
jgi:geranylgeranyl pyrophosphate synthase